MFKRLATPEAALLLIAVAAVTVPSLVALDVGRAWIAASLAGAWTLAYARWLAPLQDRALEIHVATARFDRALRLATAIRDSAIRPKRRDLGEFDVGLVHLARGAPADALRSFGRIQKHRLSEPTRRLIVVHEALARLRTLPADEAVDAARALTDAVREAAAILGEDSPLLAYEGEALLALGEFETAYQRLRRSIELDADPVDPSPGERHLLLGRAALATSRTVEARAALEIAAAQSNRSPFARAAREELARVG